MNNEEFKICISLVQDGTNTECGKPLGLILKPKYINFEYKRFKKMCNWVVSNYKVFGGRFPEIAVFEEAKKQTSSYSPDTFEKKYVNRKYDPIEIKKAFQEVKNSIPKPKKKQKNSQRKLLMEMERQEKIYDVNNRVWIDRKYKNDVKGPIVDPIGSIKKYSIKNMNNLSD